MYKILEVQPLNKENVRMVIEAPQVAKKIQPGQFIILRIDENGERIPLTMNEYDREAGTVTIIFQIAGATTKRLSLMKEGEYLMDFVGPLGNPTDFGDAKHVLVIGGGLGTAIAYSQAKWLYDHGYETDVIIGFRNKDLIILEDEVLAHSTRCTVMTDDGSNGNEGNVCVPLNKMLEEGQRWDLIVVIGPPIMMKFACMATKPYGIKTLVSMNPIMIDGTGMCGGCRVKVGGEYKHACIDGPDFDGHLVDFSSVMDRSVQFRQFETQALNNYRRMHPQATMRQA